MAGGGPLIDLGVHVLDMALFLLDEPDVLSVSARLPMPSSVRRVAAVASTTTKCRSARRTRSKIWPARLSGCMAAARCCWKPSWATHSSAGDDYGITLYGSDGGAEIKVLNYGWQDTLRIFTDIVDDRPRCGRW